MFYPGIDAVGQTAAVGDEVEGRGVDIDVAAVGAHGIAVGAVQPRHVLGVLLLVDFGVPVAADEDLGVVGGGVGGENLNVGGHAVFLREEMVEPLEGAIDDALVAFDGCAVGDNDLGDGDVVLDDRERVLHAAFGGRIEELAAVGIVGLPGIALVEERLVFGHVAAGEHETAGGLRSEEGDGDGLSLGDFFGVVVETPVRNIGVVGGLVADVGVVQRVEDHSFPSVGGGGGTALPVLGDGALADAVPGPLIAIALFAPQTEGEVVVVHVHFAPVGAVVARIVVAQQGEAGGVELEIAVHVADLLEIFGEIDLGEE